MNTTYGIDNPDIMKIITEFAEDFLIEAIDEEEESEDYWECEYMYHSENIIWSDKYEKFIDSEHINEYTPEDEIEDDLKYWSWTQEQIDDYVEVYKDIEKHIDWCKELLNKYLGIIC